jgi:hypothetical protein
LEGETMAREYTVESSIEKYEGRNGETFWTASARAYIFATTLTITSTVQPVEQVAYVTGRGRVDIGEPWPDPTRPVGLSRLLAIAEGLAVTEWERRFGGASGNPR